MEERDPDFQPRWRCKQKPFASSNNQKEDNYQSKINKQPKVLENKTAWNSDNQGIKEKSNQNNQTSKEAQKNLIEADCSEATGCASGTD